MQHSSFSESNFKLCLSKFVTGITVITTIDGNLQKHGITVNSFNSVSLNPPMILFSLEKMSSRFKIFSTCSHFIVNILNDDQSEVSKTFADKGIQNWGGLEYNSINNIPVIKCVLAYIYCKREYIYDGGDHKIIVGKVIECNNMNNGKNPLLYYKSQYYQIGEVL